MRARARAGTSNSITNGVDGFSSTRYTLNAFHVIIEAHLLGVKLPGTAQLKTLLEQLPELRLVVLRKARRILQLGVVTIKIVQLSHIIAG